MIITKICRGLGNQLYGYAAGRALALRHNCQLKLDISWFDMFRQNPDACRQITPRQYMLSVFNLPCEVASPEEIDFFVGDTGAKLKRFELHFPLWPVGPLTFYFNPDRKDSSVYATDEKIIKIDGMEAMEKDLFWQGFDNIEPPAYINGHFLSERFYKDVRDQLIKDFTFPELPNDFIPFGNAIEKTENSVSLHVRHGDKLYKDASTGRIRFVILDIGYYKKSIEYIQERSENTKFFVFSDDITWCKQNLGSTGANLSYLDVSSEDKCYHDLHLMTLCKHHIIANSTFSWWGAWLSERNGLTCTPKRWFQEEKFINYNPSAQGWKCIPNGTLHL